MIPKTPQTISPHHSECYTKSNHQQLLHTITIKPTCVCDTPLNSRFSGLDRLRLTATLIVNYRQKKPYNVQRDNCIARALQFSNCSPCRQQRPLLDFRKNCWEMKTNYTKYKGERNECCSSVCNVRMVYFNCPGHSTCSNWSSNSFVFVTWCPPLRRLCFVFFLIVPKVSVGWLSIRCLLYWG